MGRPASSNVVKADGVMKATLRPGHGDTPRDGDQVLFDFSLRSHEGPVLFSTIKDHGGNGCPRRAVLGHTRMISGLEHGLRSMQPGEIAMLRIQPQAHFQDKECPLPLPPAHEGVLEEELGVELRLLDVVSGTKVLSKGGKGKKGKKAEDEEQDEVDGQEGEEQPEAQGNAGLVVETDQTLLTKKILQEGKGWEQPRPPFEVGFRVQAKQETADSPYFSTPGDSPLVATMGQGQLPPALEKGIASMLRGEKATIFGWEEEASGAASSAEVKVPRPPSSGPVKYLVELHRIIQVRDVLGNGKVFKRRLVDGQGEFPMDCPLEDCTVKIHYKGTLPAEGNREFIDTRKELGGVPVEVGTGEGLLPEALETSIRVMLPGETALVTSAAAHAYDTFPRPDNVPEGANVQWEVELVSFARPKRWDDLSFREIMEEVQKIKELGNSLFKREQFQHARAKYEKMIRELKNVHPRNDEETREWANATISLQLNVAACYHKESEYKLAIEWADKVLEGNPTHSKALFRRGQAHMLAGDYEDAREDFKKMIANDPSAAAEGNSMLAKVKKMEEDAKKKQRHQFKGLFDKKPGGIADVGGSAGSQAEQTTRGATAVGISAEASEKPGQNTADSFLDSLGEPLRLNKKTSFASWIPSLLFYLLILTLIFAIVKDFKTKNSQEL